jgi:hypothetical protein
MTSSRRLRTIHFWLLLALMALGMAAAITVSSQARAGVAFGYDGICTGACPDIGLRRGDAVSGLIAFADAAVAPNAILSSADIVGFSLDFGAVDIDFASAFGFYFSGTLDAAASGFASFAMIVGDAFEVAGGLILLDLIGWAAGAGGCLSLDCADFFIFDPALGPGATIARIGDLPDPGPLPVPAPATGLLLLAPLAALIRREKLGRGCRAISAIGAPRRT